MSMPDGSEPAAEPVQPNLYPEADRSLVQACLHGEPAAWDAFVDRFAGLLAFVVDRTAAQRQVWLAPADRDDLLADVVMEMLHNDAAVLRGFAGRSSLATYLCVVARRVTVRGLGRLTEKRKASRPLVESTEPTDSDQGPARVADREQVESLLGQLDDEEAMLVRLHHLESRSYGEISRLTGLPLGSIGPTLARARQKMRLKPGEVPVQAGAGGHPLPPSADA
jgi:RNA polymerase sigma-70 factor (ECF subfamily)